MRNLVSFRVILIVSAFVLLSDRASGATSLPPIWVQDPGTPTDSIRSDDIHFIDENRGWSTRSTKIYRTINGGVTWSAIFTNAGTHFRSISFLTSTHGFAGNLGQGSYDGTVTDTNVLYETFDGGDTWHIKPGLPGQGMKGFCAMQAFDTNTFYGGGRVRG